MTDNNELAMKPIVLAAGQGRHYDMGRMNAVFKADEAETQAKFSVSEWWLEPKTPGPGVHHHEDDHVFYVLEGLISVFVADSWHECEKGACVVIPGGTSHDFENRTEDKAGFLSFNVAGGFEAEMPGIVQWFTENPLRRID